MSTCEKCGVEFTPSADLVEVTSLRILCPSCAAARAAAKRREAEARSAGARAGQPAAAQPAKAGAAPAAAPRPAVTTPTAPKASPAPLEAPTPAPPRTRPASAAPSSAPAAARPPRPAAAAGARATATRPAAAPPAGEAPPPRTHVRHELKKDRSVLIGWIVAGTFLVGAAVVVLKVKATKDEEHAAEVAHAAEVKGVYDRLMAHDASVPSSAAELVAEAAALEAKWKKEPVAADISARLAVARNTIESEKQRAELRARMDEVEAGLAEPELRSSDELTEIRRRIDELEPRTGIVGSEFAARVATAKKSVIRILAEKLLEEAREVGGDIEGRRAALQRYSRAEDDVRRFLEAAMTAEDKEGEAFFKERYQACITESDELLAQTYTEEVIRQVPPRDLLDPSTAEQWNASSLEGFRHELAGGTLHVWGPPAGTRALGILSIGDREQWRDWVLDLEFTLVQGSAQLYLRLGPQANATVENFLLAPEAIRDIQYGERTAARLSVIGSRWTLEFPEISEEPLAKEINWTKLRKGAIGFAIPDETELVIHRMRIRVLR